MENKILKNKENVAIVTNAEIGIGFEIVLRLLQDFKGVVYLTSKDVEEGKQAVKKLNEFKLFPKYHQLNTESLDSIEDFSKHIGLLYGGIDILVNNIGVTNESQKNESSYRKALKIMKCNFLGTVNVCVGLFPLLKAHSRVVNITSRKGLFSRFSNQKYLQIFKKKDCTIGELVKITEDYILKCKEGINDKEVGVPDAFSLASCALIVLTRIQQINLDLDENAAKGIIVSSVSPGKCKTDVENFKGVSTQGAETPLTLSLLPFDYNGPKGVFWEENQTVDYENGCYHLNSLKIFAKRIKNGLN